jgi:hypothetical protein
MLKDNKLLYTNDCGLKLISCNSFFKAATERDLKIFLNKTLFPFKLTDTASRCGGDK